MDEDIKIVEDYLLGKKMQYGEKYYKNNNNFQAIENLLSRLKTAESENEISDQLIERQDLEIDDLKEKLKTAEKMNDELIKLRTALQKEYECAMEGFMKKQISTSVVDGTIAQETSWILNELDKILGNGQERR